MRFFNSIAAALAASTAIAAPTPDDAPTAASLVARSCSTKTPGVFVTYARPDVRMSAISPGVARLWRLDDGPGSNVVKVAFSFSGLPSKGSCALQFELPAVKSANQFASGASVVNLFSTKNEVTSSTSWDNPPKQDVQYASFTVPETVAPATKGTLASFTCKEKMSFEIELADWQENSGTVQFQQAGFGRVASGSGFSMVYNC